MPAASLLSGVALGLGATALMDFWNLLLKRAFGIPSLDYCLLGRWILYLLRGTIRHQSIAATPPRPGECAAGWLGHYSIGIVLAVVFVAVAPEGWLAEPTFGPPLLYGVVTVVLPFCVLQPALGLGFASARAPSPVRARLKSLATHTVFGVGLFVGALVLRQLMRLA